MDDKLLRLDRLATFICLAEEQSFTRAADRLDLTQPAVTQQVQALERDLGVALVDRIGRRVEVTEIGAVVAERGVRLLNEANALRRDVRDLAEAKSGVLRVGATLTIGGYLLPRLLAEFTRRFPAIRLDVVIENTATIVPKVADATLGLALVEGDCAGDDLEITPFADDELIVVAAPDHPLARRHGLVARDLAEVPFVTREEGSGTRALFERGMRNAGVEPRVVLALASSEAILQAVRHRLGLAAISHLVAADALARGDLVRLIVDDLELTRSFRLVRLRLRTPSPAAARFTAMLVAT